MAKRSIRHVGTHWSTETGWTLRIKQKAKGVIEVSERRSDISNTMIVPEWIGVLLKVTVKNKSNLVDW